MTAIKAHEYMYDISKLLSMGERGSVTSFILQLDDILSQSTLESNTELRLVEETIQFLYGLTSHK